MKMFTALFGSICGVVMCSGYILPLLTWSAFFAAFPELLALGAAAYCVYQNYRDTVDDTQYKFNAIRI